MSGRFRVMVLGIALAAGAAGAARAAPAGGDPLARFEDPICPGIVGLEVDAAEFMVGRIRANAEAIGLRLADPAVCEPNIVVMFVDDGRIYFERLEAERAYLFSDLTPAERDELLADARPARALLRVVPRSRDGMPISRREDLVSPPQTTMWMAHSKIYTATRNDIYHALILFDRDAIRAMTINQLADYVTFRALSRSLPTAGTGAEGSILALFDEGAPVQGLSESDRAWLAALYSGPPNMPGSTRLAELEKASGRRAATRE